jgi:hypothetical protein
MVSLEDTVLRKETTRNTPRKHTCITESYAACEAEVTFI